MKTLLLTTLLLALPVFGQEVPSYLKGGKITVTLKNGKTYEFSADEYAVVKRGAKAEKQEPEQQPVIAKEVKKEKKESNTVIVHMGVGQDGLAVSNNGSQYRVEEQNKAVGGVTYCRNVDKMGACATAISNSTFTLGLKLDFE